jgi:hypothetical protein
MKEIGKRVRIRVGPPIGAGGKIQKEGARGAPQLPGF